MGNKIKGVILYLLCSAAAATDVDTILSTSKDESGYTISRMAVTTRFVDSNPLAPMFSTYRWSGNSTQTSTGAGLNMNMNTPNTGVEGYIVTHNTNGIKFIESDMSTTYSVTESLKLTTNISSDTYASSKLLPGIVNWWAITPGIEWSNDRIGGLVNYRYLGRTDSSNLSGTQSKIWFTPTGGVVVYLHGRNYSNSATSPQYFSPQDYSRYGVGVTYRFGWSGGRAAANIEYSKINVNEDKDTALVYKISVNQRLTDSSRLILGAGRDYSTIGNYAYNYINAILKISF